METKFNSQICTTREQSECLLSLGLKKETADMLLSEFDDGSWRPVTFFIEEPDDSDASLYPEFETIDIPAWSLGRLIEMMPRTAIIHTQEGDACIDIDMYAIDILVSDDSIAKAVSIIEWLIKEGNFNKEYLV